MDIRLSSNFNDAAKAVKKVNKNRFSKLRKFDKSINKIKESGTLIGKGRKVKFYSKPKLPFSFKAFNDKILTEAQISFSQLSATSNNIFSNNPLALKSMFVNEHLIKKYYYNDDLQVSNFIWQNGNDMRCFGSNDGENFQFLNNNITQDFTPLLFICADNSFISNITVKSLYVSGVIPDTIVYNNTYSINENINNYQNMNANLYSHVFSKITNLSVEDFYLVPKLFKHEGKFFMSFRTQTSHSIKEIPFNLFTNDPLTSITQIFKYIFKFIDITNNKLSFDVNDGILAEILTIIPIKDKNPLFKDEAIPLDDGNFTEFSTLNINAKSLPINNNRSWCELAIPASSYNQHDLLIAGETRFNFCFNIAVDTKLLLNGILTDTLSNDELTTWKKTIPFDSFLLPNLLKNHLFAAIDNSNFDNLSEINEFNTYFLHMANTSTLTKLDIFKVISKNSTNINVLLDLLTKFSKISIKTVNFSRFFGFSDTEKQSLTKQMLEVINIIDILWVPVTSTIRLYQYILNLIDHCLIKHTLKEYIISNLRKCTLAIIGSKINLSSVMDIIVNAKNFDQQVLEQLNEVMPILQLIWPTEIFSYNNKEQIIQREINSSTAIINVSSQIKETYENNKTSLEQLVSTLTASSNFITERYTQLKTSNNGDLIIQGVSFNQKRENDVIIADINKLITKANMLFNDNNDYYNASIQPNQTIESLIETLKDLKIIKSEIILLRGKNVSG